MLIVNEYKCEKCGKEGEATIQSVTFHCVRCGAEYTLCISCGRTIRCSKCGGKLESSMDWAAKNGILF